jgi:hypothetical protein
LIQNENFENSTIKKKILIKRGKKRINFGVVKHNVRFESVFTANEFVHTDDFELNEEDLINKCKISNSALSRSGYFIPR